MVFGGCPYFEIILIGKENKVYYVTGAKKSSELIRKLINDVSSDVQYDGVGDKLQYYLNQFTRDSISHSRAVYK